MNATVDSRASRILTVVSCSSYNHNTSFNGALGGLAQRIGRVAFGRERSKAQVDYANVLSTLVGYAPVNAGDYVRAAASAIGAKDPHVQNT
jgi:hypothetical protein